MKFVQQGDEFSRIRQIFVNFRRKSFENDLHYKCPIASFEADNDSCAKRLDNWDSIQRWENDFDIVYHRLRKDFFLICVA